MMTDSLSLVAYPIRFSVNETGYDLGWISNIFIKVILYHILSIRVLILLKENRLGAY